MESDRRKLIFSLLHMCTGVYTDIITYAHIRATHLLTYKNGNAYKNRIVVIFVILISD